MSDNLSTIHDRLEDILALVASEDVTFNPFGESIITRHVVITI